MIIPFAMKIYTFHYISSIYQYTYVPIMNPYNNLLKQYIILCKLLIQFRYLHAIFFYHFFFLVNIYINLFIYSINLQCL